MEYSGLKQNFRYWLPTGTPVLLAGGERTAVVIYNEGGPQVRVGNVTGTPLATFGMLLPSGVILLDTYSDDEWWAINIGGGSGSISGYIVRSNL